MPSNNKSDIVTLYILPNLNDSLSLCRYEAEGGICSCRRGGVDGQVRTQYGWVGHT